MKPQHVDPEEAVMIHQDIKSMQSFGIHWGTFKMTTEVRYTEDVFSAEVKVCYIHV